jgi:hypothetical protein
MRSRYLHDPLSVPPLARGCVDMPLNPCALPNTRTPHKDQPFIRSHQTTTLLPK